MKEKIKEDIKTAMRGKNELRLLVLRMLAAAIHNKEIEKRARLAQALAERAKSGDAVLSDEEVVVVIRSEAKKRRDAIVEFEKGNRQDLVVKESAELKILEEYLPQELPDEEIEKIVKKVVAEAGEVSAKDFGRIMGEVMKGIKGQASGERVSNAVKRILT